MKYAIESIKDIIKKIEILGFDMPLTTEAIENNESYDKIVECFRTDKSVLKGLINDLSRLL